MLLPNRVVILNPSPVPYNSCVPLNYTRPPEQHVVILVFEAGMWLLHLFIQSKAYCERLVVVVGIFTGVKFAFFAHQGQWSRISFILFRDGKQGEFQRVIPFS